MQNVKLNLSKVEEQLQRMAMTASDLSTELGYEKSWFSNRRSVGYCSPSQAYGIAGVLKMSVDDVVEKEPEEVKCETPITTSSIDYDLLETIIGRAVEKAFDKVLNSGGNKNEVQK